MADRNQVGEAEGLEEDLKEKIPMDDAMRKGINKHGQIVRNIHRRVHGLSVRREQDKEKKLGKELEFKVRLRGWKERKGCKR